MLKKIDIVRSILGTHFNRAPVHRVGSAFASTNIALCKYWGKRDQELNLPVTSSLSISLGEKGATAKLQVAGQGQDSVRLNDKKIDLTSSFGQRLIAFFDLFRTSKKIHFSVILHSTVPIAAGLASSACGFASLIKALDALFGWELSPHELSILARLGSGSACRSIEAGFVGWRVGSRQDGMDSYGEVMKEAWPALCVGLLVMNNQEKAISSREAMQRTVANSPLYSAWPKKVAHDLLLLEEAIKSQNFQLLGKTAESNAMTMHATMQSAWPPIMYHLPETLSAMQKIWQLREEGLSVYFTQDAGPNLKLLFLEKEREIIKSYFPELHVIQPFNISSESM